MQAILNDPDSDTPRLIYADWLEENGEFERATFIRTQIELAKLPWYDVRNFLFQKQQERTIERNRGKWEKDLPKWVGGVSTYRRGFPARVWCKGVEVWLREGSELFDCYPIEDISFDTGALQNRRTRLTFLRSSLLQRLRNLEFSEPLTEKHVRILVNNESVSRLKRLSFFCMKLGDEAAITVAESRNLAQLEELILADNQIGTSGFEAIVCSENLQSLKSLSFGRNRIVDADLSALSRSSHRFTSLELDDSGISDQGMSYLSTARCVARLEKLSLACNPMTVESVRSVFASPHLSNLRELTITRAEIGDLIAGALSDASSVKNLRYLDLSTCQIGTKGCEALAQFSGFRNLIDLDLCGNAVGDDGVKALAKSSVLENLLDLKIDRNGISSAGAAELARSPMARELIRLSLNGNAVDDEGAIAIATSATLKKLAILNLNGNRVGDTGAVAIAENSSASMLHLAKNRIGDAGAVAFLNSPTLPKECYLMLHANEISREMWTPAGAFEHCPRNAI